MSDRITDLPVAATIDAVNDTFPIVTNSLNTTQQINRNTFLNLASQPVGLTDSQTMTNKTLTSPTINGATLSGTLTGTYTIGGTPTFPSSVTQNTATQTLTNKTLTSPTINSPSITNATITADTLSGYTTSNSGSIYGMSVTGGVLASAALAGSVNTAAIQTNAVSAAELATNAITLGYASTTSNFTIASGTATQVTGLTATVTIPAGGRKIKITAFARSIYNTSAAHVSFMSIWDGTVNSGTELAQSQYVDVSGSTGGVAIAIAVVTPSAGSKTYNVGLNSDGTGTAGLQAASTYPAFILVEAI
jgi:hypothetical protein